MTWRHLYLEALERLADRQAARWFVEEASGGAWPVVLDEPAPARAEGVFRSMLARRAAGEPVQYVLGHWAFRRLDLMVDRRVLIPRPETEVVVEVALGELARLAGHPLVVDLGTGSGAIALSIVTECAGAEVWATDLSEDALAVASANLTGLGAKAAGQGPARAGELVARPARRAQGHARPGRDQSSLHSRERAGVIAWRGFRMGAAPGAGRRAERARSVESDNRRSSGLARCPGRVSRRDRLPPGPGGGAAWRTRPGSRRSLSNPT